MFRLTILCFFLLVGRHALASDEPQTHCFRKEFGIPISTSVETFSKYSINIIVQEAIKCDGLSIYIKNKAGDSLFSSTYCNTDDGFRQYMGSNGTYKLSSRYESSSTCIGALDVVGEKNVVELSIIQELQMNDKAIFVNRLYTSMKLIP